MQIHVDMGWLKLDGKADEGCLVLAVFLGFILLFLLIAALAGLK